MTVQPPDLVPLRPRMAGRRMVLPPRTAFLVLIVALVAFVAGLQVRPPPPTVTPGPSPSGVPPASLQPATLVPTGTPVVASSPLPLGVYHVTQPEAVEIALAAQFYAAYNAGQLTTVMTLLSARPVLFDCDYSTRSEVHLTGRSAIAAYLRARFAEHDHWTVEFYQADPAASREIVVLPLRRSNDTLRRLGAPGGAKTAFPEDFYLAFNPDRVHLDAIAWNTMSGSVGPLCSP